ncbi:MAG: CTP synthase [bacterium]|nr:CTP synthase [bacterium]
MAKEGHKYIFVVGGVMSSVGKGITAASIGLLIKSRGYRVTNVKCEMYVNIDAGTIRPTEHGEVFVGVDGIETDQDLGNYERFTGQNTSSANFITQGQIWQEVIRRERNLEYNGEDVEVVPDIPNEIIRRIKVAADKADAEIVVVEIGGTIGEYQISMFLEAARMMKQQHPENVAFVMVSYLPIPKMVGEMKTKPTQYAARTLNSAGIMADFIVCRADVPLDEPRRRRLALLCNVPADGAISAPDVNNVYEVPLNFAAQNLDIRLLEKFGLKPRQSDLKSLRRLITHVHKINRNVKIAIVGKYFGTGQFTLADSYVSVIEAAKYSGWKNGVKPEFTWIDSETYEKDQKKVKELKEFDGILVPGGFGSRGIEGIISAIAFAREHKISYLGLCYGMQLMVIEYARNVLKLKNAHTTEIQKNSEDPVVDVMLEQKKHLADNKYGGTMRLGVYPCYLKKGTIARTAYKKELVEERHRHRYEINPAYVKRLEDAGLVFSGTSPDGVLMEIAELPKKEHPFMLGTQFHPEFQARPLAPHPLFTEFLRAAISRKRKK